MKPRSVPKKEAIIQRIIRLHDRGMKPGDIVDDLASRGVDVNIQWVSHHLIKAGKIKSDRAKAKEKKDNRAAEIRRAQSMHYQGHTVKEIAEEIGDVNPQWVSYHVFVAGDAKSEKAKERERINKQDADSENRMVCQREERKQQELEEKNSVRGRIGDLRDSVEQAFRRVCGTN